MRRAYVLFQLILIVLGGIFLLNRYYANSSSGRTTISQGNISPLSYVSVPTREAAEQVLPVPDAPRLAAVEPHIQATFEQSENGPPSLWCPGLRGSRYDYLRIGTSVKPGSDRRIRYFFAVTANDSIGSLPRLLASVIEVVNFLGPQACAVSLLDHGSIDGSYEFLYSLKTEIEWLGAKVHLATTVRDDPFKNRSSAILRNLAMSPMLLSPGQYATDAAVLFLDGVAICSDDILELIHQREFQQADMTCGMEWSKVQTSLVMEEVHTARDMRGETLFEMVESAPLSKAHDLFWASPASKAAYYQTLALQVFSCWAGAVVTAASTFAEDRLAFRDPFSSECFDTVERAFCKDMWMTGHARIALVPSVNFNSGHNIDTATEVKRSKGHTSTNILKEALASLPLKISWRNDPPEVVKCILEGGSQVWALWDQGLSRHHFT